MWEQCRELMTYSQQFGDNALILIFTLLVKKIQSVVQIKCKQKNLFPHASIDPMQILILASIISPLKATLHDQ